MAHKVVNVVTWKGRTTPGQRVIPRHLKLAILSRGRIELPSENVLWLLERARDQGLTWVDRLDAPFEELVTTVPVTFELFWQQPQAMLDADIEATIAPYLTLRHERHLEHCWYLLYGWSRHPDRRFLTDKLDVDLARLYAKPRVFPRRRDEGRYIVLAYVCLPMLVREHVAPEKKVPASPPPPPAGLPPLLGQTAGNVQRHVRTEASTSAPSLGELDGDVQLVDVLSKARVDDLSWYQIQVRAGLRVNTGGTMVDLAPGTTAWVAEGGLDVIIAPWETFRAHLAAWEQQYAILSLRDRITKLRQLTHSEGLPFDLVIGTATGTEYAKDRASVAAEWQPARDYHVFRAPDGQLIDIHHLLVGLDALQHPEGYPTVSTMSVGSNWAAATWSGDIGAGVADMQTKRDKRWEKNHKGATRAERIEHYYGSRAADHDLFADIDVWHLDEIRRDGTYETIDMIAAAYYEDTIDGQLRTLTRDRRLALAAFLRHYGFSYDVERDYAHYPVLGKQREAWERLVWEIGEFAQVWLLRNDKYLVASRDEEKKRPDQAVVAEMATLFLRWLENAAIEYGVVT